MDFFEIFLRVVGFEQISIYQIFKKKYLGDLSFSKSLTAQTKNNNLSNLPGPQKCHRNSEICLLYQ